ncbi:MAG TPA: thiamine pyrophosphate-requiring protein [Usitatibacter sp.]|nr:thiamine pyrophosphate-requiring protein [Usitatibacter sp.]
MAYTVSHFIVDRLHAWGVRRVFGYPGDGINGVIGALAEATDRIDFVEPRHEEMAAFMASGHAKVTGEIGVCLSTAGPGAVHLLNGLYDAKADHQPVLAVVGQQARSALGSQYQQEIDLAALFKDVASPYVQMITTATQARHVVDRAVRIALAERCPTCIIVPSDVQELEFEDPPRKHLTAHSGIGFSRPRVGPTAQTLADAARVLNAGERVAILVGAGAAGARSQVLQVADVLGAGIAKALLGKHVIPDDIAHVTGTIGFLGTRPTYDMMVGCDTLLMIGSGFPYGEFLPPEGKARGVQIDIDGRMLGLRYPMEVNIQGDAAQTLELLLPLLERKGDRARPWREKIEAGVRKWWDTMAERAALEAKPVNPQRVFSELSPRLPGDAMIATDTGTTVFWYARHVRMQPDHLGLHSGGLASMGAAMPYALAAKFAYPSRPAFALVGDGAMQMSGMNELITLARYWKRWSDPRFVILVLNNRDLTFVSWEQRIMKGDPKFPGSQDVPDVSYAGFANLLGIRGIVVSRPEEIAPAWDEAIGAKQPVLIEAMVDPDVPMLPPHITVEQAGNYLKAILRGDPDAAAILKASIKEILA